MVPKRYFIVTEMDNECKHLCWHEFEASDYRSLISLTYYFQHVGTRSKRGRNWTDSRLYHLKRKDEHFDEFERQTKHFKDANIIPIPAPPLIIHKSIWDFYTYIGYDYKKQKYL